MANFIGLKNLFVAELVEDNKATLAYGEMKHIPGLVKISLTPEKAEASYYSDNILTENVTKLSKITASIQCSTLDLKTTAFLLGHQYDEANGKIICNEGDVAPTVGIAYERTKSDGTSRFTKLFKGQFSLFNEETETAGESVTFQDQTIEAVFMPLINNGQYKEMIEETETNADEIAKFFEEMIIAATK